jgi:hypothetical protein
MKEIRLLLKSCSPILAKLPLLVAAVLLILLCVGAKQAKGGSTTPGLTTFDAPGAGTTAKVQQGTSGAPR